MKKRFFILASQSPRRIAFLKALGLNFRSRPVRIDERVARGEAPAAYLRRITISKFATARAKFGDRTPIVAADTIVVIGRKIIGKPDSLRTARRMLRELSGKRHVVWTTTLLFDPGKAVICFTVKTGVTFSRVSKAMLEAYLRSKEWKDKAGAYAVRGLGSLFIKKIEGSLSNVIGFPLHEFLIEAERLGIL